MKWQEIYDIIDEADMVFAVRDYGGGGGGGTKLEKGYLLGAIRSKIKDEERATLVLAAIMEEPDYIDMDVVDGFVNPVPTTINWEDFYKDILRDDGC